MSTLTVANFFSRLKVKMWLTENEPWVMSVLGHEIGQHAPGLNPKKIIELRHIPGTSIVCD